jgi:hypothetical protein
MANLSIRIDISRKPQLRLVRLALTPMWCCAHAIFRAYGRTPREAYVAWRDRVAEIIAADMRRGIEGGAQ